MSARLLTISFLSLALVRLCHGMGRGGAAEPHKPARPFGPGPCSITARSLDAPPPQDVRASHELGAQDASS